MKRIILLIGLILLLIGSSMLWINSPYRYILESKAKLKSGKTASAIELLTEGLSRYQNNTELNLHLARAYLQLGKIEDANNLVEEKNVLVGVSLNNELLTFILELAIANQQNNNNLFAKDLANFYLKLIENKPVSLQIAKELIKLSSILQDKSEVILETALDIAGRYENNEAISEIKIALLPKYLTRAEDLLAKKQFDKALEILNTSEKLGKDSQVSLLKAKIFIQQGDINKSQTEFEDAIELNPNDTQIKIAYAEVLNNFSNKTTDKTKKVEYLEKASLLLNNTDTDILKSTIKRNLEILNTKFKITDGDLSIKTQGEFSFPILTFKIIPLQEINLKTYKVIFETIGKKQIDVIESIITKSDLNNIIEVQCTVPVSNDKLVYAKLLIDGKQVQEFISNKQHGQVKI